MAALATADEFKSMVRWSGPDSDAAFIDALLTAATATIKRKTGRAFVSAGADADAPTSRTITTYGDRFVRIPDLRSTPAPTVTLSGLALSPTSHYVLENATPGMGDEPTSAYIDLGPAWSRFTFLGYPSDLVINGWWGIRPTDEHGLAAKRAVLSLAVRGWKERDAAGADQVVTPEGIVRNYFKVLPGDVQDFIDGLRIKPFHVIREKPQDLLGRRSMAGMR